MGFEGVRSSSYASDDVDEGSVFIAPNDGDVFLNDLVVAVRDHDLEEPYTFAQSTGENPGGGVTERMRGRC